MIRPFTTAVLVQSALLLASAMASTTNAQRRHLEPEDYFKIRDVGAPQISPDGKEIAYTVGSYDFASKKYSTQIWTVSMDGSRNRPMTSADFSSSSPRYSPDGKYLSFTSIRTDDQEQIWLLPRGGGEARPASALDRSVGATVFLEGWAASAGEYAWSPDSKQLLVVLKDSEPEDEAANSEENDSNKGDEEKVADPWVVTRRQFKLDYEGYLDNRRSHIYLLDVDTQSLRQLTTGDFDDLQPTWSPDGRQIAFTSNRTDDPDSNYDHDIWIVDVDEGDEAATPRKLTSNRSADRYPAWHPGGNRIAYVTAKLDPTFFYRTNHLAVVDVDSGRERLLTSELDRNISDPKFSPDGEWIYFSLEDSGEQNLARIPSGGGKIERLITGSHTLTSFEIGPDGKIAALSSLPDRPSEIFVLDGTELLQTTDQNGDLLQQLELGTLTSIELDSADGTPVEALVLQPPGFVKGQRYPTILYLHGGPQSQHDFSFDFKAQLWAANGYLVVMPNPRGSTGYGEEFCLGIWQAWGGPDHDDVMASVDAVIAQGWADADRLAVTGWSYGGMLTNHVITKTDRFKAAVTGASATLYVVNYGHDHYQRWWEDELGLPWEPESRKLWESISPFNRVQYVVTPTLIVGGEHDWNVPIINSEQLFMALKRLGVETELVVYPNQHHSITEPAYVLDSLRRYLDWFATHLDEGESEGADS